MRRSARRPSSTTSFRLHAMVDYRKPEEKDSIVIDISLGDLDDNPTPAPLRDNGTTTKQKRSDPGSRPKVSSQRKTRQIATKSAASAPRIDLATTSTHSGPQPSHARSQQQSQRSTPSAQNSTLAQRIAGRRSESRESSSGRQNPRIPSSSGGKANSPPPSQVQISREPKRLSSAMLSKTNPTNANANPGPSDGVSKKKRRREPGDEVEQSSVVKRLRSSQRHDPSSSEPAAVTLYTAIPGMRNLSGSGNDSNPIVISDSPPPEVNPTKHGSHTLPDRQRTPKQPMALAPKTPGMPSSSKLQSPNPARQGGNRRQGTGIGSTTKSPTIPESLPGSSPERDRSARVTGPQSHILPRLIHPSDKTRSESVGAEETLSNFAAQAQDILDSQLDEIDVAATATATRGRNPQDIRTVPPFHSDSLNDTRSAIPKPLASINSLSSAARESTQAQQSALTASRRSHSLCSPVYVVHQAPPQETRHQQITLSKS